MIYRPNSDFWLLVYIYIATIADMPFVADHDLDASQSDYMYFSTNDWSVRG